MQCVGTHNHGGSVAVQGPAAFAIATPVNQDQEERVRRYSLV
jgi:hypothetical protein